jgi:hypothetical protein
VTDSLEDMSKLGQVEWLQSDFYRRRCMTESENWKKAMMELLDVAFGGAGDALKDGEMFSTVSCFCVPE